MSDRTSAGLIGDVLYLIDGHRSVALATLAEHKLPREEVDELNGVVATCTTLFKEVFEKGGDYDFSWDQAVDDDLLIKYGLGEE